MWDVPNWDRPPLFRRNWFHAAIWLAGTLTFVASVLSLWVVNAWLCLVPFALLVLFVGRSRFRRESQVDAVIKKAILLEYELKRQGLVEQEVYRQIAKQLTNIGDDDLNYYFDSKHEWTLENLIQFLILPLMELWHHDSGSQAADIADMATMRDRIKGFRESFEGLRVINRK